MESENSVWNLFNNKTTWMMFNIQISHTVLVFPLLTSKKQIPARPSLGKLMLPLWFSKTSTDRIMQQYTTQKFDIEL